MKKEILPIWVFSSGKEFTPRAVICVLVYLTLHSAGIQKKSCHFYFALENQEYPTEIQIRRANRDNSKIIFLIFQ